MFDVTGSSITPFRENRSRTYDSVEPATTSRPFATSRPISQAETAESKILFSFCCFSNKMDDGRFELDAGGVPNGYLRVEKDQRSFIPTSVANLLAFGKRR
jgi:hypothetical protein